MASIPELVDSVLKESQLSRNEVDLYLIHQATLKMLQQVQERLEVDDARYPVRLETCGNTVSSTLPILINDLREERLLKPKMSNMLIGFGVGWSWAACMYREVWSP
jgi:3-oxoacyl-[acyl-carrier-protein] synthase-3